MGRKGGDNLVGKVRIIGKNVMYVIKNILLLCRKDSMFMGKVYNKHFHFIPFFLIKYGTHNKPKIKSWAFNCILGLMGGQISATILDK